MDIRKIKKLIELVEESGIAELEITEGEESVRINRHSSAPIAAAPVQYAAATLSLLLFEKHQSAAGSFPKPFPPDTR